MSIITLVDAVLFITSICSDFFFFFMWCLLIETIDLIVMFYELWFSEVNLDHLAIYFNNSTSGFVSSFFYFLVSLFRLFKIYLYHFQHRKSVQKRHRQSVLEAPISMSVSKQFLILLILINQSITNIYQSTKMNLLLTIYTTKI